MTREKIESRVFYSAALMLAGLFVSLSKWFLGIDLTYWGFLGNLQTIAWLQRVLNTLADLAIVLGVVLLIKSVMMVFAMNRMFAGQGVLARWRYPKEAGKDMAVLSGDGVILSGKLYLWKSLWTEFRHAEIRCEQGRTQMLVWFSSSIMFMMNGYYVSIPVPPGRESEAAEVMKAIIKHADRSPRVNAEK
jgi:hypothetical protein